MPLYFVYTMVQKSQKWPKTHQGGPAFTFLSDFCFEKERKLDENEKEREKIEKRECIRSQPEKYFVFVGLVLEPSST